MASDLAKYKVQILNVFGFSMTVPLGRMLLSIFEPEFPYSDHQRFFALLVIAIFIALLGIIVILRGIEHLK